MDINIKELCQILNIEEKQIIKLIKNNEIPFYKVNKHYRFNKGEIIEWLLLRKEKSSEQLIRISDFSKPIYIIELIKNGGVFYNIEGKNIKEILKNIVDLIELDKKINKDELLSFLIEREEMMPTYIGNGIAIPHPKKPIISENEKQMISICFLKDGFEYGEKNEKLHTIFLVISANQSNHLKILSMLSFLFQKEDFSQILKERKSKEEIIFQIEKEFIKEKN